MNAGLSVQTGLFNTRAEAAFSQSSTARVTGFICAPEMFRDASLTITVKRCYLEDRSATPKRKFGLA